MLTVGSIRMRRATGEVRPRRREIGWKPAIGANLGCRGDDHAAAEAIVPPCRLLGGPETGYSAINQARMGRLSGKCGINLHKTGGMMSNGAWPANFCPGQMTRALWLVIDVIMAVPQYAFYMFWGGLFGFATGGMAGLFVGSVIGIVISSGML